MFTIDKIYHDKLVGWQEKNYPDMKILLKYWDKYFPGEEKYSLGVKLKEPSRTLITSGVLKGKEKFDNAGQMKGNMLYSALGIIKAQCSTELGSIQQHICTVDSAVTDEAKFSILRIMAEELRHAYQMFWVVSHDSSWSTGGIRNLADNTLDELLSMSTGTHVLDAFNIPFSDPLDNIVFAFMVDRVGKHQLTMQKDFSYSPMAQSMLPMLHEESFHLKTGYELLKEIVIQAAESRGNWTLNEIQKRINVWYPRALEMFGNPDGGSTNITFGFKDRLNGEAFDMYVVEVDRLVQRFNLEILKTKSPDLSHDELKRIVQEDPDDDFLYLPNPSFFRMRGLESVVYKPTDVSGKEIVSDNYFEYLRTVLPEAYMELDVYKKYRTEYSDRLVSN